MSTMNLTKKEIDNLINEIYGYIEVSNDEEFEVISKLYDAQIDTYMSMSLETHTCFQSIKRINLLITRNHRYSMNLDTLTIELTKYLKIYDLSSENTKLVYDYLHEICQRMK
jgi:DNA-directed RNA polymerase delta subunit